MRMRKNNKYLLRFISFCLLLTICINSLCFVSWLWENSSLIANAEYTPFNTFNLSETELKKIASLCQQEQGSAKGAAAEASLMANRFELYGSKFSSVYDYARNSGWFAKAGTYMDKMNATDAVLEAVRNVLIYGKRTVPGYIDEHDCFSDLSSCINNGSAITITNRSQYKQFVTIINNKYGSTYTFYCFPTSSSDPFGYISQANRNRIGDAYWDYDTWTLINEPDPITCSCSESYAGTYYISTQETPLPFRTDHSSSSSKVSGCESIPKGAEVYVSKAGTVTDSVTWAHVIHNGYEGYCNFAYLTKKEAHLPVTGDIYIVTTESSNLNIRNSPSTGGDVIGKAPKSAELTVYSIDGGWAYVNYNGIVGYCSANYLTINPVPTEPIKVIPSQPTLTVSAGTNFSKTKLNWNVCSDTDWYDIRIYKSDGTNILTLMNQSTNVYSIPLTLGDYYANIASVNSNGNYTFSSDINFSVGEGTLMPTIYNSFNGHVYAVYDANLWYDRSREIAENTMGGHLVTITSAEENAFVQELISNGKYEFYWIGGTDTAKEGSFVWTNGETMNYTNWSENQPDNYGGNENYMMMYKTTGLWNDNVGDADSMGFVVEIDELNEITSEIYNKNNYAVFDGNFTWTEARTYCEMLGGHLAYVEDAKENEFITRLISNGKKDGYWLGGEKFTDKISYQWTNGASLSYTNWGNDQPDHWQNKEYFLEIYKDGKWNDNSNVAELGFVCEFENYLDESVLTVIPGHKTAYTNFSWTPQKNSKSYTLKIWNGLADDGEPFKAISEASSTSLDLALPDGYFEAYVETTLNNGNVKSNVIKIKIKEDCILLKGDANADGEVTIADAVMLQKWLLCASDELTCWQNVDLCKDDDIDVFDFVLLKCMILAQTK